jgi:pilus assembly protein Flp/PilA
MMSKIISAVKTFVADENGVTAIEYGLIAALIGVSIAVAAGQLGDQLSLAFDNIKNKVVAALAP